MRVAFVSMGTSHDREGAGYRRLERVAGLLADRGHDVTLLCAQWWDDDAATVESDGVTYRRVTRLPDPLAFALRLPVVLVRCDVDVVHAGSSPVEAVVGARVGAWVARTPLAVEWYGDARPGSWGRYALRGPDAVVTPSELVRTRVRELGATPGAVRVIPESIDFSLARETTPAATPDVVYARRLDADANLESLLLALAELRGTGVDATVIGDGPAREGYEQQARDLRIDDTVTFVGERPLEERVATYKGAHVFAQTAARESFAVELLWALACGCVGIVEYQADSSAHELIEGYDRSFRVTTPQEVADAIVEADDLDRRQVDESFARYDHDAVAEQYLACYRDLRDER